MHCEILRAVNLGNIERIEHETPGIALDSGLSVRCDPTPVEEVVNGRPTAVEIGGPVVRPVLESHVADSGKGFREPSLDPGELPGVLPLYADVRSLLPFSVHRQMTAAEFGSILSAQRQRAVTGPIAEPAKLSYLNPLPNKFIHIPSERPSVRSRIA